MSRNSPVLVAMLVPAAVLLGLPGPAAAQDAPVCVYDSRSFSEGASICVQRHLMMSCTLAERRAVWTLVHDRALSRMCAGPSRPAADTAAAPRRQVARRAAPPAAGGEAKCFTFGGRRYCE